MTGALLPTTSVALALFGTGCMASSRDEVADEASWSSADAWSVQSAYDAVEELADMASGTRWFSPAAEEYRATGELLCNEDSPDRCLNSLIDRLRRATTPLQFLIAEDSQSTGFHWERFDVVGCEDSRSGDAYRAHFTLRFIAGAGASARFPNGFELPIENDPLLPDQSVVLRLETLRQAPNAYPETERYFADGVLRVVVFIGYHEIHDRIGDRGYDLALEAIAIQLRRQGFLEVSGTLGARFFEVDNVLLNHGQRAGKIRVELSHAFRFARSNVGMERAANDYVTNRLATADVFVHGGHSGPGGFRLTQNNSMTLAELRRIEAPPAQLVFMCGCNGFGSLDRALRARGEHVDVISTTNTSYPSLAPLIAIARLTETVVVAGQYGPERYYRTPDLLSLMGEINTFLDRFGGGYWGITGIEDNSALHPSAVVRQLNNGCAAENGVSLNCGNPDGNVCIARNPQSARECGVVVANRDACPPHSQYFSFVFQSVRGSGSGYCLGQR